MAIRLKEQRSGRTVTIIRTSYSQEKSRSQDEVLGSVSKFHVGPLDFSELKEMSDEEKSVLTEKFSAYQSKNDDQRSQSTLRLGASSLRNITAALESGTHITDEHAKALYIEMRNLTEALRARGFKRPRAAPAALGAESKAE